MSPELSCNYALYGLGANAEFLPKTSWASSARSREIKRTNLKNLSLGEFVAWMLNSPWGFWNYSLGVLRAFGLPSFFNLVPHVDVIVSQKKVGWTHAGWLVTAMKALHSVWNFLNVKRIRKSVGVPKFSETVKASVISADFTRYPNPTLSKVRTVFRGWPVAIHFFKKPFSNQFWNSNNLRHAQHIPCSARCINRKIGGQVG